MCLLAIYHRVIDGAPVIVAANREEAYARGGTSPDLRHGPVPFVAGLDPAAGGTWLGINAAHVVVAVTNRRKSNIPEHPRSRGLLAIDLLGHTSARAAADAAAKALSAGAYAGCNVVCAGLDAVWVVHAGDWLRVRSLAPGIHVLTNGDVNDDMDERVRWVAARLHDSPARTTDEALAALKSVVGHTGPPAPVCLKGAERGTVSSTLLALDERPRQSRLWHAAGPPDATPFADRTDLLWELEGIAERNRP